MIKDIVKDEKELSIPCEKFRKEDIREIEKITKDLIDTATYYAENDKNGCVGLAANQIGYNRRIIIVNKQDGDWEVFVNPVISNKYGRPFISEEGCLSLEGIREAKRYKVIDLLYRDPKTFKIKSLRASGGTAVIIQHEVDHVNGILI